MVHRARPLLSLSSRGKRSSGNHLIPNKCGPWLGRSPAPLPPSLLPQTACHTSLCKGLKLAVWPAANHSSFTGLCFFFWKRRGLDSPEGQMDPASCDSPHSVILLVPKPCCGPGLGLPGIPAGPGDLQAQMWRGGGGRN